MLRRSVAAALLLAAVAAPGAMGFVRPSKVPVPLSMKQQPEQGGLAPGKQQQPQKQQDGLGQAVARAVGRSLAVGGVALSSFMGLGLGLGVGVEGAGAAGWQYDKQTVQKQVARVDKAEQKELRDEVKDPANVIAKVRLLACVCAMGVHVRWRTLTGGLTRTKTTPFNHPGHRAPPRDGGLPARAGPPQCHQLRAGERQRRAPARLLRPGGRARGGQEVRACICVCVCVCACLWTWTGEAGLEGAPPLVILVT